MSDDPVTRARENEEIDRTERNAALARIPMAAAGVCLGIYVSAIGFEALAAKNSYARTNVFLAGTPAGWLGLAGLLFAIASVVWLFTSRR